MGMMAISLADTDLIAHLRNGGNIEDDVSLGLIDKIVANTLANPSAGGIAQRAGLTAGHLRRIYISATQAIMPDPVIRHGKTIITTSLVFQDFDQFSSFVQLITSGGTLDPESSLEEITQRAASTVFNLREAAIARGKGASMTQRGSGCASIFIATLALWLAY